MTTSYLPYEPQPQMQLPHALQEWLPEGHLAYYDGSLSYERDNFALILKFQ